MAAHADITDEGAEDEFFSGFRRFEPAAGSVRVGVTHEKDGLIFVFNHAHGQVVGRRLLAHHAGSQNKEPAAAQTHLFHLCLVEHNQVQGFRQPQIAELAMDAMGFKVVNLGKHAS